MTTTSSSRAIACALSLALAAPSLVTVRVAVAAPSAADMESARQLFKQGKDLRDKGDLAGARDKLKAAHALGQTPITGLELGKTHVMLHELVEAREAFLSVGRIPVASDETKKSADARVECDKLAADLKVKIPTVKVTLVGVPKGKKPKVTVDEEEIPFVALTEPRAVNPGKHVIVAKVTGAPDARAEIEVIEGENKAISLYVKAPKPKPEEPAEEEEEEQPEPAKKPPVVATPPPPPPPPPAPTPKPAEPAPSSGGGTSILVPIGFIVAGVGLVAGGATGGLALAKAKDVKAACPNGVCSADNKAALDETKTLATVSNISFGVMGVGAVIGIVGLVIGKGSGEPTHAHVQPYVGLGTFGLTGAF